MSKFALVTTAKNAFFCAKAAVKTHAPEILLCSGVVSFVGTVVLASKATIKAQDILEDHREMKSDIDRAKEEFSVEEYTPETYKKDLITCYSKTSLSMAKIYIPAIALGALSIACFLTSYGILKRRNVALIAAYNGLSEAFNLYRKRVIEDRGEEADQYYLTGVKPKEITVTNEDGSKEKKKVLKDDPNFASPYAFYFWKYKANGERNYQYQGNASLDRLYLNGQQDYLNDLLFTRCKFDPDHYVLSRGVVLLNEIRDICGEDPTETGAVVGNRYGNGEPGCNGYIDLHISEGLKEDPETGEMLPIFYLNPNVDGLVYDLIGKREEVPFLPTYSKLS